MLTFLVTIKVFDIFNGRRSKKLWVLFRVLLALLSWNSLSWDMFLPAPLKPIPYDDQPSVHLTLLKASFKKIFHRRQAGPHSPF
ncbi:hypothetical protein CEXT_664311, partial [Caerostris extrusa]